MRALFRITVTVCLIFFPRIEFAQKLKNRSDVVKEFVNDLRSSEFNSDRILEKYIVQISEDKAVERKDFYSLVLSELHKQFQEIPLDRIEIYSFKELPTDEQNLYNITSSLRSEDIYVLKVNGIYGQTIYFKNNRIESFLTIVKGRYRIITLI